jgi:uncharacterized membrane protein YedE/YeeE
MDDFTPGSALVGGALIGLSSSLLLLYNGRIAGISGIVGGLLRGPAGERLWRAAFVLGLLTGGLMLRYVEPEAFTFGIVRSTPALVLAGLLVGIGTQRGSGCTSGHGVCGISRGSARSIVATSVFMATGALAVYIVNHVLGGAV